jgi:hypothetical protein
VEIGSSLSSHDLSHVSRVCCAVSQDLLVLSRVLMFVIRGLNVMVSRFVG